MTVIKAIIFNEDEDILRNIIQDLGMEFFQVVKRRAVIDRNTTEYTIEVPNSELEQILAFELKDSGMQVQVKNV